MPSYAPHNHAYLEASAQVKDSPGTFFGVVISGSAAAATVIIRDGEDDGDIMAQLEVPSGESADVQFAGGIVFSKLYAEITGGSAHVTVLYN